MENKQLNYVAIILLSLAIIKPSMANEAIYCDGTTENPCVVQDTNKDTSNIKHWRTAQMLYDAYKGNTTGLKHLWASASGVPSEDEFKIIAEKITKITNTKHITIIDLDLREESHAYLNKNAITLNNQHDWINLGKTHQQSIIDEQNWIQTLENQSTVFDVLTKAQFKAGQYQDGINIPVISMISEQSAAEKAGFNYIRLTISDHMAPRDEETNRFVLLIKQLPKNTWLHIHCRGGSGRSTTVFAMYDMLKNADKVSFNDIIMRQASVSPFYDLSKIKRKDPDLTKYYQARFAFLRYFYQYANASLHGYTGDWFDWIKQNSTTQ